MPSRKQVSESHAQVPQILHLLAHPLRWQIVNLLKISDLRVQELVDGTQQPYNLVSYHLKMLRSAGLVSLRKSDADSRDLYYNLDTDKLQNEYQSAALQLFPGWGWQAPTENSLPFETKRVLFLCTHNSARSQMAEAMLRHFGGKAYQVSSAGSQPQSVHPEAIAVMDDMGIDIRSQRAKHLDEFRNEPFDIVITVCDRVREEKLAFYASAAHIHWSIPDPIRTDLEEQGRQRFISAANELKKRINFFIRLQDTL